MLNCEDVVVKFGGVRGLDGVSLTFERGISGLVGPNGAGKTTMLNVLSGFVSPSSGRVEFDGLDLLSMNPTGRARWGLRRTFQQEQSVESLTVWENLLVAAENLGTRPADARQIADLVGLTELDRPVPLLSMLERRLLELGRTILGRPRILLLDEPVAGLPEAESLLFAPLIERICEEFSLTVVLVDHDMDFVTRACSNIAVLDFGRLIAYGDCVSVLSDPAVEAAYLGVSNES